MSSRTKIVIAVCILTLSFLPYWILGEKSIIKYHDNLDSDVVWFSVTSNSGHLLSFSNEVKVDQFMNGIPRNSLMPGLSFVSFLFFIFSPFWAYLINFTLVRIVAFIGMYLFLRDYVFKTQREQILSLGVALAFAYLPYWGVHSGIGISGLPLIAWAFINIVKGNAIRSSNLIIVLFPFYGSLIYTGVFYMIIIGAYWVILLLKEKKINRPILIALVVHGLAYFLAELNLFIQMIGGGMVSHRTEKVEIGLNFLDSIQRGFNFFVDGQYHAPTLNSPIIITVGSLAFLWAIYQGIKNKFVSVASKSTILIYLGLIMISLFYGIWKYALMVELSEEVSILKVIQWDRFHWLAPFLWFILLAFSLKLFLETIRIKRVLMICSFVLIAQIAHSYSVNAELKRNYSLIGNPDTKIEGQLSFDSFYSEDVFKEIAEYINKPQENYRVVSVGFFPEISTFNGFYSLDSYQRNYPLEYKQRFRKIIAPELEKELQLKSYFDDWGSRCYAFSSELGKNYMWGKASKKEIEKLDYEFDALQNMGGEYILSALPINKLNNQRIEFLRAFENENSFWKIYLYKVL